MWETYIDPKTQQKVTREVVYQPLYDYVEIAAATATSAARAFQVPNGSGGKTLADTNMEVAGTIPSPRVQQVEAIGIHVKETVPTAVGVPIAELRAILEGGVLVFGTGSKNQFILPLVALPPGFGVVFDIVTQAAAATGAQANNGQPGYHAAASLRGYPIVLDENENISCELQWPTAVTVTAATKVGIYLAGPQTRGIQ
jgi:hypothetical protein